MAVNRTRPSRAALFGALALLLTAAAGFAAAAPNVKLWLTTFREPVTLQPELPSPLPPMLLLALLAATAVAVSRSFTRRGGSRGWSGAVYALGLGLVFLRFASGPMVPPPASPQVALRAASGALDEVALALDEARRERGRLPAAEGVAGLVEAEDSPWRSHGRTLPYRIVAESGQGARLRGRAGDLPGTIYCVTGGDRYWLTTLVLAGSPTGRLDFLRRDDGAPRIVTEAPKPRRRGRGR